MSGFLMVKTRPFYHKENIFRTLFFIKKGLGVVDHLKSRHNLSGFQMVKKQDGHNLATILFLPFEIQTKKSGFRMVGASLTKSV
jgi:hypothetical protein